MGLFLPSPSNPKAASNLPMEDVAWHALYRSAHDPSRAAEVVEYLENDEASRKSHLALYLVCRQTMRAHEIRQIRIQRFASLLQLVVQISLVMPVMAVLRLFRGASDLAVELKPNTGAEAPARRTKAEPAAKRVRKLVKQPEFAQAMGNFPSAAQAASSDSPAAVPLGSAPPAEGADGTGAEAFAKVAAKAA